MWIQLTIDNDEPILVDTDKVLTIKSHSKGSYLTFTTAVPGRDGVVALKGLVVHETISQITKLLKPRLPSWRGAA